MRKKCQVGQSNQRVTAGCHRPCGSLPNRDYLVDVEGLPQIPNRFNHRRLSAQGVDLVSQWLKAGFDWVLSGNPIRGIGLCRRQNRYSPTTSLLEPVPEADCGSCEGFGSLVRGCAGASGR
jgi:hypothetical protein